MDAMQEAVFLQYVQDTVAKNPLLCRKVIDAATEGVKDFADKQRDLGSQAAFKLVCVLEEVAVPSSGRFGRFTTTEIFEALEGPFGGTPGLKKLKEKFGVPQKMT